MRSASLVGCAVAAAVLGGCGGGGHGTSPRSDAQRTIAGRFADAVLHGDTPRARALLLHADDPAIDFLVRRATSRWKHQRVAIAHEPRSSGSRWTFGYAGTRSFADGRFAREDGSLLIVLASSQAGPRVRYFAFVNVRSRFSTHHDGQLLPSKR